MIKRFTLLFIVSLFIVNSALAQGQAGTDIAVLNAGVGARALGMGGAFTAIADNADAPYWNPGGLGFISTHEITTMQTKLSTDADHYYISYVQPALGGTIGISWVQIGLGNISQTSKEVDYNNEVQNISIFSYFSNAYMLAYGKELNEHISVGLTAKYLTSDMMGVAGGSAYGYSITPGVLLRMGQVNVGLKVDELLNEQSWGTGTVERVHPVLRLGLAYQSLNPGTFAIDISQTLKSAYAPEVSAGYEYNMGALSFRVGAADGGLTAGAGFGIDHVRVDYAYVSQRVLSSSNVHRISLSGNW